MEKIINIDLGNLLSTKSPKITLSSRTYSFQELLKNINRVRKGSNPFFWSDYRQIGKGKKKELHPFPVADIFLFKPVLVEFSGDLFGPETTNKSKKQGPWVFLESFDLNPAEFTPLASIPRRLPDKNIGEMSIQTTLIKIQPEKGARRGPKVSRVKELNLLMLELIHLKIKYITRWRKFYLSEIGEIFGSLRSLTEKDSDDFNNFILKNFPILGLPPRGMIADLLEGYMDLPGKGKIFFDKVNFFWKEIEQPLLLPRKVLMAIIDFLEKNRFTFSECRHIFQLARENLYREKKTENALVADLKRFQKGSLGSSGGKKSDAVTNALRADWHRSCYPEEFQFIAREKDLLSKFNLPRGVQLKYPPFFEGDSAELVIKFKDNHELKSSLAKCLEIAGRASLDSGLYRKATKRQTDNGKP